MFNHMYYVPILRWKEGELSALEKLYPPERKAITPLIETFGSKKQATEYKDPKILAKDLYERWQNGRVFVDISPTISLAPRSSHVHPVTDFFNVTSQLNMNAIPVIRLRCGSMYRAAVKDAVNRDKLGLCIRLARNDFADGSLVDELGTLVTYMGIERDSVDLVLDLAIFSPSDHDISDFLLSLPNLLEWRTITVASGAFPKNLQEVEKGPRSLPRLEWQAWKNQVRTNLPRIPTYGDYATLHPFLTFPEKPRPSCSIKYTIENDWLIVRGWPLMNGHKSDQYHGEAKLLIEHETFCGQSFSYGDNFIYETAQRKKGPGNFQQWVTVGVNHHLTFVVHQIAKQFGNGENMVGEA